MGVLVNLGCGLPGNGVFSIDDWLRDLLPADPEVDRNDDVIETSRPLSLSAWC